MTSPRVSVVMPVYDGEPFVGLAVASVLRQTLTDFELVVCDNASTDDTLVTVGRFGDERIRVLGSPRTMGPADNWNRAIAAAGAPYVKLMCADDLLAPDCLESQLAVFEAPGGTGVVLVSCPREVIDPAGRARMSRGPGLLRGRRVRGHTAIRAIARSGTNPVGEGAAVLARTEACREAGLFRQGAGYAMDVDYWVRVLLNGDAVFQRRILAAFRVSPWSWTANLGSRQAQEYRAWLRQLAADPRFGLTPLDVAVGSMRAGLNSIARRLVFALLSRTAPSG